MLVNEMAYCRHRCLSHEAGARLGEEVIMPQLTYPYSRRCMPGTVLVQKARRDGSGITHTVVTGPNDTLIGGLRQG